jgi:hypothetical protein
MTVLYREISNRISKTTIMANKIMKNLSEQKQGRYHQYRKGCGQLIYLDANDVNFPNIFY